MRLTTRRIMIGVAIVALLLTGPPTVLRWSAYRRKARLGHEAAAIYEEKIARNAREIARGSKNIGSAEPPPVGFDTWRELVERREAEIETYRKAADWYEGLGRKYDRAARTPWVVVPEDTPLLIRWDFGANYWPLPW